jgi:hypothetical protein
MVSVRQEASREYERMAILGMAALALAALLHGWRNLSARAAEALVFVIVLFELGTYTGAGYRNRESPGGFLAMLDQNRDIVEFLTRQPDFARLEVNTDDVPYNIGDWEGIDQHRGYLAGMTSNVANAAPEAFAMNYFLAKQAARPTQQEVFQGRSGLRVFRNPDALPFVRAVHDCGGDDVRLVERGDSRFVVDARMACPGTVVVSETFFPGWKAAVDGREAPVREMFGAVQGVDVPAGQHRVELNYRPISVFLGAAMTALGLLCALALAFISPGRLISKPRATP